ncbi:MAG TPA: AMP-binding protein, partial [Mycobacterium sp.]
MTAELNLGRVIAGIAAKVPDRVAVIHRDVYLTYGDLVDRASRLAQYLADRGYGCVAERSTLKGHEAGQHLMAQFLYNGPAYVEGLVGGFLARVAPFNVNYRYLAEELTYLFNDSSPAIIQYHASFAPALSEVLPNLSTTPLLLQVEDDSGNELLPGAVDYDAALNSVHVDAERRVEQLAALTPDDLYIIYTGGTTGMPKGVLWRQADVAVSTMGLLNRRTQSEWASPDELFDNLRQSPTRVVPCAPMMHGAAQWAALGFLGEGNTIVFPDHVQSFAPDDVLAAIERQRVTAITIVGDAFGWPLVKALERGRYDVSSLRVIVSGGASLHADCKSRLIALVPGLRVIETMGSSESGILGRRHSVDPASAGDVSFEPDASMAVVSEDFSQFLEPGHDGNGWLARRGRIPLGYLGDADKTARTFPVIDGQRVSIPGDRARLLDNGQVQLLGRDSLTINTGGEKVFVEEVEAVLKDHP